MLAQSVDDQNAEGAVIVQFNQKLAARVAKLQKTHFGVSEATGLVLCLPEQFKSRVGHNAPV